MNREVNPVLKLHDLNLMIKWTFSRCLMVTILTLLMD